MNEDGISLIEILLVVVFVGIIVMLMANLPNAISLINKSQHSSLAREIAAKQIEDKRAINYANLVNDTIPISDSRIGLLPQGLGQVKVEDCDSTICANSEPIKKVTVEVLWVDNQKQQQIRLETFIGEGGLNQ